jgi:transposase
MPTETLSKFFLLPELHLTQIKSWGTQGYYWCVKERTTEHCPRCAQPSNQTHDLRRVTIKDAPIRGNGVLLYITKRRLWCKPCRKPFTERVPGIRDGKRHTERYQQAVTWAAENFSDLKQVRRAYKCSSSFLYQAYYSRLERKLGEKLNYAWTTTIGIDEHSFKTCPETGRTQFVSMIVDYNNRRVRELALGKTGEDLRRDLAHIPGRENVKNVVIDMCDPFKNFAREFFPNSILIADKFHVLRLLSPTILKHRKEITGDRASARARRLLLMSAKKLDYSSRLALFRFLEKYPELKEIYDWKERVHGFYRIKGYERARIALTHMTDSMALSPLKEIKTLRRTLMKWREEILNYFRTGLTNARTEGFNNKAKVVKRRGYGYKSFRNYRLKVLTACA